MAFLRKFSKRSVNYFNTLRYQVASIHGHLKYSEEVQQAKLDERPILALESTIITHGMPYPQNLETAMQVEHIVRKQGAIPATIAILKGQLTVGLTADQLKYLSNAKGVVKASRRDLAPIVSGKLDGATTVAGTLVAAELADIPVFATGGIGGVHRQGEQTWDVSADLTELGRSRTLVVCSGVKSILDIGRTLEYLETQGVCVCTFGNNKEFPAFYTVRSGYKSPYNVSDALDAARVLISTRTLGLKSGVLVAVPVPTEYAMDEHVIENAISEALKEANSKGIQGKEVTPFLLSAIAKTTAGDSLNTNIALIKNNAKVGANIAVEFNKLKNSENSFRNSSPIASKNGSSSCVSSLKPNIRGFHTSCRNESNENIPEGNFEDEKFEGSGPVVFIGGANVDRTYKVTEEHIKLDGSTHASCWSQSGGGVARNMAEALWRMRGPDAARLVTTVGDDADGRYLTEITPGLIAEGSTIKAGITPNYAAVLDRHGECKLGLGDMTLHQHISTEMINKNLQLLQDAPLVVVDGNPPLPTIQYILDICNNLRKPVLFEPTDRRKAVKPFINKNKLALSTPNASELIAIATTLQTSRDINCKLPLTIDEVLKLCTVVSDYISCIIVTLGENGVMTYRKKNNNVRARLYPVTKISKIINVSGAGDCFTSGFINGLLSGMPEELCVAMGIQAARDALCTNNTVPINFRICDNNNAEYTTLN